MRRQIFGLLTFCLAVSTLGARKEERVDTWISLFDGKTMSGWRDPRKLTPPGSAWSIEGGCLKANPNPEIAEDLISSENFDDFELEWEWKIARRGNSGLKYRIQALPVINNSGPNLPRRFEDRVQFALKNKIFDRSTATSEGKWQIYPVGFEYQMIDNENHPDAKHGPKYQTAALYGIAEPRGARARPIGQFNQSRILVCGRHIQHWLNGQKVVDLQATPALVITELSSRWGFGAELVRLLSEQPKQESPIALQDHGDAAWFRNIKIRRLH